MIAAHAAEPGSNVYETPVQVFNDAIRQAIGGPGKADLGEDVTVRLAEGQLLVPNPRAQQLLRLTGRSVPKDLIGLLMDGNGMDLPGLIRFVPAGFVDADAITGWRPADFLASLNDSLDRMNAERRKQNQHPLLARGWVWPPHYDRDRHLLSWAALILPDNAPRGSDGAVAYYAVALGRDGFVELSFIASVEKADSIASMSNAFLNGLQFRAGKQYGDVTPTDKRADGGIAGVMGIDAFRRARGRSFWSTDAIIPAAGAFAVVVGAISLLFYTQRAMRRRARRA
ncbi:MAG: hypothetical protein B7Z80_08410 [Rhodospirillales bacterium 20-64-7]|nr:MAG: hypothetical protein B7Z80_08410 [Rhodospirillales bacterium 20-64-7]